MSLVSGAQSSSDTSDRLEFEKWMIKYDKHYDTEDEKQRRFKVFQELLRKMEVHNSDPTKGHTIGLNLFSDMTPEEFRVELKGCEEYSDDDDDGDHEISVIHNSQIRSLRPVSSSSSDRMVFEKWMIKHNKHYDTEDEKEMRFKVFQPKIRKVEVHNSDPTKGHTIGLDLFADMTPEEFKNQWTGCAEFSDEDDDFVLPFIIDRSRDDKSIKRQIRCRCADCDEKDNKEPEEEREKKS